MVCLPARSRFPSTNLTQCTATLFNGHALPLCLITFLYKCNTALDQASAIL